MRKNVWKRCLALLLSATVLFTSADVSWAASSMDENGNWTHTAAGIVAEKYYADNTKAKDILEAAAIQQGTIFEGTAPLGNDDEKLAVVDGKKGVVYANTFADGDYTWVPSLATVMVEGTSVTSAELVSGSYTYDEVSYSASAALDLTNVAAGYSVVFEYVVKGSVDVEEQQKLLQIPADLVAGYQNLIVLKDDAADYLSTITTQVDNLYQYKDTAVTVEQEVMPGYVVSQDVELFDAEGKAAIEALYDEFAENNNKIQLDNLVSQFTKGRNGNGVAMLVSNGAAFEVSSASTYEKLNNLLVDAKLETLYEMMSELSDNPTATLVAPMLEDLIFAIEDTTAILEDLKDEAAWACLDSLSYAVVDESAIDKDLEAAVYSLRDGVSVPTANAEEVILQSCEITRNVGTVDVTVVVKAEAVSKESNEVVALPDITAVLSSLSEDITETEIAERVANAGFVAAAISNWNLLATTYAIDEDNYTRTDSYAEGVYTVAFSPKSIAVDKWGTKTEVPYGTEITLEEHSDESKAWDYTVNGKTYLQGATVTATETLTITRKEGTARETIRKFDAVADYHADALGAGVDILKNATLISDSIYVRKPTESEVGNVEQDGNGWKLRVTESVPAGLGDKVWTPVVTVKDETGVTVATPTVENGYARWKGGATVTVEYRLDLDLDEDEVKEIVELPKALYDEMSSQNALLQPGSADNVTIHYINKKFEDLYSNEQFAAALANLSMLTSSMQTEDAKEAIKWMTAEETDTNATYKGQKIGYGGWNSNTGKFAIYSYLQAMDDANWNLSTYYKDAHYKNIGKQAEMLTKCLTDLSADQGFKDLLKSMGYGDYISMLSGLAADLETMVEAMIDAPNPYIDLEGDVAGLVSTVLKAVPPVFEGEHVAYATYSIERTTPDKTSVNVRITANGKTYTSDEALVFAAEEGQTSVVLSETQAAEIQNLISEIDAKVELTADEKENYYIKSEYTAPKAGDSISGNVVIKYTYTAKEYTVEVQGTGDVTISYNKNEMAVTLPAPTDENTIYYYSVLGVEKAVYYGAPGKAYFSVNDLANFVNGTYTITRRSVQKDAEDLNNFVAGLNNAMGNDDTLEFALVDGAMVISVDSNDVKNADAQTILMGLVENFALGTYQYVGFGDTSIEGLETAFKFNNDNNETKLNVQPVISLLLTSYLSTDSVSDGLTSTSEAAAIAEIEKADYGEVMGASYVQLGNYKQNDEGTREPSYQNLRLYLAFKDSSALAKVQEYVAKAEELGLTFSMDGGKLHVNAMLPEKAYQVYLSGLFVLDLVDIEAIEDAELREIVEHHRGVLEPVLKDTNTTTQVLENTLEKLGYSVDLSEYADVIDNKILPQIRNILNDESEYVSIKTDDVDANNLYGFTVTGNFEKVLDSSDNTMVQQAAGMLVSTTAYVPVEVSLENMKEENLYEALVLDLKASGVTNKFFYTKDLAKDFAKTSGDSIVILLTDVDGEVVFDQNTLLNLNGKTINGNVTATKALTIVDSSLGNGVGGVTGTITGSDVDVTAGKYNNLDSSMIADGYELVGDVVVNKYYTVETDKDGNVTVTIATDYADIETTDVKSLALDIAADVLFDWFTNGAVSVDGNTIYDVNLLNLLEKYTTKSLGALATELTECVDEDGVTAFANKLIDDLTNFEALAAAANGELTIASYDMVTKPWTIAAKTTGKDGYIDVDITTGAGRARTITVKFDKADADLAAIFTEIDKIVTIDESYVELTRFIYENGEMKIDGKAIADVTADFTQSKDATVIMAIVLANGTGATAGSDFAAAIQKFIDTDNADDLKGYFDALTLKQITEAARAARNTSFADMVKGLGLNISATKAAELEDSFHTVLKVAYALIDKLDIENNTKKLGGLAIKGEYATYGGTVKRKAEKLSLTAKLILFKEVKDNGSGSGGSGSGGSGSGGSGSGSGSNNNDTEYEGTYYPSSSTTSTGTSTGDANNAVLWISVMGIAVVAVVAVLAMKKRKAK